MILSENLYFHIIYCIFILHIFQGLIKRSSCILEIRIGQNLMIIRSVSFQLHTMNWSLYNLSVYFPYEHTRNARYLSMYYLQIIILQFGNNFELIFPLWKCRDVNFISVNNKLIKKLFGNSQASRKQKSFRQASGKQKSFRQASEK